MKRLALFAVLVLWRRRQRHSWSSRTRSAFAWANPSGGARRGRPQGVFHVGAGRHDRAEGLLELFQFPGVDVMLRKAEPTGPPGVPSSTTSASS